MAWSRRRWLGGLALLAGGAEWIAVPAATARADGTADAAALLRQGGGGLVVALRHALAPGTFDPAGYRLEDCSTQRNLNDEGREQARRIGRWFAERSLAPSRVRSSAWCRCLETARLAFGAAEPWAPLNSMIGEQERQAAHAAALRAELARLARSASRGFEVWVTHQVNITALAGGSTGSGEAVLLRQDAARDALIVAATLRIA